MFWLVLNRTEAEKWIDLQWHDLKPRCDVRWVVVSCHALEPRDEVEWEVLR